MRRWRSIGLAAVVAWLALAGSPTYGAPPPDRSKPTLDRGAIVRGPRVERRLALVFTADEYGESAPAILGALKARGLRATFFLTGRFLRNDRQRPTLARLKAEGHQVGPHSDAHLLYASWDRPPRLLVTRDDFRADLEANLRALDRAGFDRGSIRFFLPPYEHYTEEVARWTSEMGLTLVNLTPGTRSAADYMPDADPHFVPAATIAASILEAERTDPDSLSGFLLLMHLGAGPGRTRDHLSDRLPALLDELARRGYRFARVDELLAGG